MSKIIANTIRKNSTNYKKKLNRLMDRQTKPTENYDSKTSNGHHIRNITSGFK